jgi:hypothetical protein
MTTPTPDEICERLRLAVRENTGWEPSMSVLERAADEAADLIQQQQATIERLSAALEKAEVAMTCGHKDGACYCPNCDNSFYGARDEIRAALESTSK